jgi:hypothetical protein
VIIFRAGLCILCFVSTVLAGPPGKPTAQSESQNQNYESQIRSKIQSNAHIIQRAVEEYAEEHNGEYPYSANEIAVKVTNPYTKRKESVKDLRDAPNKKTGTGFTPGCITYEYEQETGVYVIKGYAKTIGKAVDLLPSFGFMVDASVITLQNDETKAKEGRVRANAILLQDIVEAYARSNGGNYPRKINEIPNDYFQGEGEISLKFINPFTRGEGLLREEGRGFLKGYVTYTYDEKSQKYYIQGYGENMKSGEDRNGTVITLTNERK